MGSHISPRSHRGGDDDLGCDNGCGGRDSGVGSDKQRCDWKMKKKNINNCTLDLKYIHYSLYLSYNWVWRWYFYLNYLQNKMK